MAGVTIGEAVERHRVPAHVLRHWEDVGALRPDRSVSGHRRYDDTHHAQIELIKCGKAAGLTLDEIAVMLHGARGLRGAVLANRLSALRRAALEVEASMRMLQHVSSCDAVGECPECAQPHETFRFPSDPE